MAFPPRRQFPNRIHKPRPPRKIALGVLYEWHRGEEYAVSLIDEASDDCGFEPRDTALLQTLVYSVIRNQSLLDHWAGMLTGDKNLDRETLDAVRLGLAQLLILDMKPHAAVNETVEHAGRAGALVNAVLRRALREKASLLEQRDAAPAHIRYSHPKWLVQRWAEQFGEAETIDLCAWNQQPAPIYVRLNRLVAKKPTFEFLDDHGDDFYSVERVPHDAIEAGECYVQDPSTRDGSRTAGTLAQPLGAGCLRSPWRQDRPPRPDHAQRWPHHRYRHLWQAPRTHGPEHAAPACEQRN